VEACREAKAPEPAVEHDGNGVWLKWAWQAPEVTRKSPRKSPGSHPGSHPASRRAARTDSATNSGARTAFMSKPVPSYRR
jgi:hypothetical protein